MKAARATHPSLAAVATAILVSRQVQHVLAVWQGRGLRHPDYLAQPLRSSGGGSGQMSVAVGAPSPIIAYPPARLLAQPAS